MGRLWALVLCCLVALVGLSPKPTSAARVIIPKNLVPKKHNGDVKPWKVRFSVENLKTEDGGTGGQGSFTLKVHPEWSLLGSDRFRELISSKFFEGNRIFRVMPNFIVQWGISGDTTITDEWANVGELKDEKLVQTNKKGTVVYATNGKNTRGTQIFVNLADNKFLDDQNFVPFAEVTHGLDVIERMQDIYGELPQQSKIRTEGSSYLEAFFPQLSYIDKADFVGGPKLPSTAIDVDPSGSGAPSTDLSPPPPSDVDIDSDTYDDINPDLDGDPDQDEKEDFLDGLAAQEQAGELDPKSAAVLDKLQQESDEKKRDAHAHPKSHTPAALDESSLVQRTASVHKHHIDQALDEEEMEAQAAAQDPVDDDELIDDEPELAPTHHHHHHHHSEELEPELLSTHSHLHRHRVNDVDAAGEEANFAGGDEEEYHSHHHHHFEDFNDDPLPVFHHHHHHDFFGGINEDYDDGYDADAEYVMPPGHVMPHHHAHTTHLSKVSSKMDPSQPAAGYEGGTHGNGHQRGRYVDEAEPHHHRSRYDDAEELPLGQRHVPLAIPGRGRSSHFDEY